MQVIGGDDDMDYAKLRGVLSEKKKSYRECALALGMSVTSFSNKMNRKSRFSVPEANGLSEFLELSDREKLRIFFDSELACDASVERVIK